MPQRFRNLIGPNVRALRLKQGLRQDDLAARLQLAGLEHLDRVGVAKIESQIRSIYDFEVIVLANVLKVPTEELLVVTSKDLKQALPSLVSGRIER